jgi:hypothetical protein
MDLFWMSCDSYEVGAFFIYVCCVIFFEKVRRLLVVCTWKMTDVMGWREKTAAKKINRWATVGKGLNCFIYFSLLVTFIRGCPSANEKNQK